MFIKIFIVDMLKKIPKSDISIRPFKAYKQWSFDQSSNKIDVLYADETSTDITYGNNLSFPKNSLYGQLIADYYNGNENNPFLRFGDKALDYDNNILTKDRYLSGSAKVISIPQIYVGEGIQKGSVVLIDSGSSVTLIDDGYGNIKNAAGPEIIVNTIDVQNNLFEFTDIISHQYTASLQNIPADFDLATGQLVLTYNSITYTTDIISYDVMSGVMFVTSLPFLTGGASVSKAGNVFYSQGIIVLTRNSNLLLNGNWNLNYNSTQTIYENEYLLIVEKDEFNVSTNPSSYVNVGKQTDTLIDTNGTTWTVTPNPGINYIRKKTVLNNGTTIDYRYSGSVGNTLAGFEEYELSSSIDTTGSFLAPLITTIGLYDDNADLVAVAKLPKPIKSLPDLPVNFIVRFDT